MSQYDNSDLDELKRNPTTLRLYTQRLKMKKDGRELVSLCPFHSEKTPSFRVYQQDGMWFWTCHGRCNKTGDVIQFVEKFDKITTKEAIAVVKQFVGQSWEAQKAQVEETFQEFGGEPEGAKEKLTIPLSKYAAMEQRLAASAEAIAWLQNERGITLETAQPLHLGYIQNVRNRAGEKNRDIADKGWIAMPCIQGDRVVSLKFRSIVRKVFCRESGMAITLFNTETVDMFEPVYLVEGEFDAAAMEQAGFRAVSLPSAGFKLPPEMKDLLMQADVVILAGDNDGGAGTEAMDQLWRELGDRSYLLNEMTAAVPPGELGLAAEREVLIHA